MKKVIETLKAKNIGCGYLYFYIHFITEIMCFYFLTQITNNANFIWLVPFIYDGVAFVPQSVIGYISDKFPRINFSLIGTFLMIIAFIIYYCMPINTYVALFILCIGNACIHVNGAEVTLKNSEGKLSHSAIFVAGGSFGVITGKLMAQSIVPYWTIILLGLTMIPFILLANTYENSCKKKKCSEFNYANRNINAKTIILLAMFIIVVRGYMGYGIPTAWNKTTLQTVLLYSIMGLGKALGGILSDAFGIRKIAMISTLLSIPFLCFGDNIMIISLIGVMFFSMTMSITLAILVSALKNNPGLAFGLTTIGLFLGTAPIFFITITNSTLNIGIIITLSILCTIILSNILRKEEKYNEMDIS